MKKETFEVVQKELLKGIPEEFRDWISAYAYEHGHANGYSEVTSILEDVIDGLAGPIEKFEKRIKSRSVP